MFRILFKAVLATAIIIGAIALSIKSPVQQSGSPKLAEINKWKVVGGLTDGLTAQFVEVAPPYQKDAGTYREAADHVCNARNPPTAVVAFFITGDIIPVSQGSRAFFDAGGWGNYRVTALHWCGSGSWTRWDCDRIGNQGAPPEALCGTDH